MRMVNEPASPQQKHSAQLVGNLFWSEGLLESLGDPTGHINKDGLDYLTFSDARLTPWSFTGLPPVRAPQLEVSRSATQMLFFSEPEVSETVRRPPRTLTIMMYLPLAIVRGAAPMFSDAKLSDFLEFWKGVFVPLFDCSVHYLTETGGRLPTRTPLVYINRQHIEGYLEA